MCGIAGIVTLTGSPAEAELVPTMLARLAHRGPDDEGCVALGPAALGMRRLSILDPTPRGHQPMASADGRLTIVHNGEIYNFLELAAELRASGHRFASETDTEVILAAYAAWGPACVERFNGIWAFAIWDSVERTLFISRDRFGVKPVFLVERNGTIAFASELKALRALPWVAVNPEPGAVYDYLASGRVDQGNRTFYQGIERLAPATSVIVRDGRRLDRRYWQPHGLATDSSLQSQLDDEDRVVAFRALLTDAVRLQLRSDVPIGSCLSGGIDSSSIVCLAAAIRRGDAAVGGRTLMHAEREARPQRAFFAEFREADIDERPFVDAVVAATGVELHTTSPDATAFLKTIDAVVDAQDEPFGSLSIVAQYHVMQLARRNDVKVLLDGQGADELLGGYRHYAGIRLAGALRSGRPATILATLRSLARTRGPFRSTLGYAVLGARRLPERLVRGRMPATWIGSAAVADDQRGSQPFPAGTLLAQILWREVASDNLPGLLRYEDRNSMAFGIEARVPFLDHRLVEASLQLPDRLRIAASREHKVLLRRAMQGIVPTAVLGRRDKVAFQPPEARWLEASRRRWDALAARPRAEAEGLLARGALRAALDGFAAGRVTSQVLWRVINTELWFQRSVLSLEG